MIFLPHGEYNINTVCQNSCLACNHFTPLQPKWTKSPEAIKADLELAARLLHFEWFCILGGEPTLHPRLSEILDLVRASGITDKIKLNTNGQNCERWDDAFFAKVDHVQCSPYKITDAERAHLKAKCQQYGKSLDWQDLGFRKVGYKTPDAARGRKYFANCWYKVNRHVIEDGYFYYCCVGRWIPETLLGLPREVDAIALDGLTEERLRAFLDSKNPPQSCSVCSANMGQMIGWREERDKAAWLDGTLA